MEKKSFNSPDEVMNPSPKTKVEIVSLAGKTLTRSTFQPGWKWSADVAPVAGTDLCQAHHFGVVVSGRLHVKPAEGSEQEVGPGDVIDLLPGHDAWVVGDDAVVMYDFAAN